VEGVGGRRAEGMGEGVLTSVIPRQHERSDFPTS
jgi:hypothetical protein